MSEEKKINTTGYTFEELILLNQVYVDKTQYIYNLLASGYKYVFLSRPRRFGKSITIQTFEELFNGKKELFNGLYIKEKTDWKWEKYPVLHFDFSKIAQTTPNDFSLGLGYTIDEIANSFSLTLSSTQVTSKLDKLLSLLFNERGQVVVLIDEYDSPITNNAFNPEIMKFNAIYKEFFSVLKADSKYLKFVFITGITRYAKVGIFSGMNNIKDISLDPNYATMLGYTKEEIQSNFSSNIQRGIKSSLLTEEEYIARLKREYDGYRFSPSSPSVYNPVSIGEFFSSGNCINFENYWSQTGNTTLLMNMAEKNDFSAIGEIEEPIDFSTLEDFDVVSLVEAPTSDKLKYLMYQTGYLTIKKRDKNGNFILTFPNNEVRTSFNKTLLSRFINSNRISKSSSNIIYESLRNGESERAIDEINVVFSSLPFSSIPKGAYENQYKGYLEMLLIGGKGEGERVISEDELSGGKPDIIIELKNHVYIIEGKLDRSPEEGIEQIINNGYALPYASENEKRTIHLIGLSFSSANAKKKNSRRKIGSFKEVLI